MNENYTAEDFARATLATRGAGELARRAAPEGWPQWLCSDGDNGEWWCGDADMADDGWVPVLVESRVTEHTLRDPQEKAARKREKLVDHIADQDRVIRRRNDEITALRLELADAQAPLSLDSLAAAWEAAEVPTDGAPIRAGDVVIEKITAGAYAVMSPPPTCGLVGREFRVLSRAPKREPHENLADAIREVWPSAYAEIDIGSLAYALHERGVRVTGGDE